MEETTTHRPVRLRHVVAVGLACAIIGSGVSAFAAGRFSDVPPSHPFYDEISWMEDTGISTGYVDGTYRPEDPVTRQAMSAFMARLFNLQAGLTAVDRGTDGGSPGAIDTWTNVTGLATSVTIPPGTTGRIVSTFSADLFCNNGDNSVIVIIVARPSCDIRFLDNGVQMQPGVFTLNQSLDANLDGDLAIDAATHTAQASSNILGPGTHNITVQMMANDANSNANDTLVMEINEHQLTTQVFLQDASL